jgi:hypothetical protein
LADCDALPEVPHVLAFTCYAQYVQKGKVTMTTTASYKIAVSKMSFNRKIPPADPIWPKFNASFENVELEPQALLDTIYYGFPITTWHKDHWRDSKNYLCGQHLGLDFDHGNVTLDSLLKDPFITKYSSFIYTTMSSTDENPRCRAIFLIDQPIMQSVNYAMAASSLLWAFGDADRSCRDSVRFWYGSLECKFEWIGETLPLEVVKKMIDNYKDSGITEKRKSIRSDYQAPVEMQEVADALKLIDPWKIEYDQWLAILMAIHSTFGEGGYMLAESWGQGKGDEIDRKWKSFKASGNTTGAVGVGTIFGIAKQFGWHKGGAILGCSSML